MPADQGDACFDASLRRAAALVANCVDSWLPFIDNSPAAPVFVSISSAYLVDSISQHRAAAPTLVSSNVRMYTISSSVSLWLFVSVSCAQKRISEVVETSGSVES